MLQDEWILATDYCHYVVTYGCLEQAEDGTCLESVWRLNSRTPILARKYLRLAESVLERACVDFSDPLIVVTAQEEGGLCADNENNIVMVVAVIVIT